jgi:hypothetical protein
MCNGKGEAIPIQVWTGPEGSRIGLPHTHHKKRRHFPCMLHKKEDISAKRDKKENIYIQSQSYYAKLLPMSLLGVL